MIRSLLSSLAAAAILGMAPTGAMAQEAPAAPAATVKIYSGGGSEMRWFGIGPARTRVSLCVVSTSGRFQVEITSESGGQLVGPDRLPYEIRFRDGAGREQSASTDGQALIVFEGSAPPAENCTTGANSELELFLPESALTAGLAGSSFDRLQISATPL